MAVSNPIEVTIPHLYEPRSYQLPVLSALDEGCKRVLIVAHRRSGKDITALNYTIKRMCQEVGVYFYIFPTYNQARKVIWDSITNEGFRLIDHFPKNLIESMNASEMKIRLKNGSLFQLVGSDKYDSLMGTNPRGVVFSEYALQDKRAWEYIKPILTANGGWAFFISTPRGKNHLFDLWCMAQKNPNWFTQLLTIDDTGSITEEDIDRDRKEGMSEDMVQQEYYCSFNMGIEGAYYGKYMDILAKEGRITKVPYQKGVVVNTYWDLGMDDSTSILFVQIAGQEIHIIDCYEAQGEGLSHYAKVLQDKGYIYGDHFAPHDIEVRELGTGVSRKETAANLGIHFQVAPNLPIADGIEAARCLFDRLWIDHEKSEWVVKCLTNYHKMYDAKRQAYGTQPVHDYTSHIADAFRYMAVSLPFTRGKGMLPSDTERMRKRHGVFNNNIYFDRFNNGNSSL